MFVKGRISTVSSNDSIASPYISKFMFYNAGGGLYHNFKLTEFFIPGVSLGVYYTEVITSTIDNSEVLSRQHHRGVSGEVTGFLKMHFGALGFYGGVSYHFIPILQDGFSEWQTSAFSIALGLSWWLEIEN